MLELVEGPTLADRIGHGAIPLHDALPIAQQIADALEAAHEQWIIHRDLKPSNIKLRADGVVKVLDFGLAKALDPLTRPSGSLSPGGERVWVRGRHSCRVLPPNLPAPIIAVLRRCLEKDRRKRIGEAAAALVVIDDAVSLLGTGSPDTVGRAAAASWRRTAIAAAVVVVATTGAAIWIVMRPNPARVSRLTIAPAAAHALAVTGEGRSIAISHDGNRVAYVGGNGTLLVRSLDQLEPTILVREDSPIAPFFSRAGRQRDNLVRQRSSNSVRRAVLFFPAKRDRCLHAGRVRRRPPFPDDPPRDGSKTGRIRF